MRIVLDRIVREVREAQELIETGDTYLAFEDYDGQEITYYFEAEQGQIRRNVDGSGHTIVGDGITGVEFDIIGGQTLFVSITSGQYKLETKVTLRQIS